MNPRRVTLLTDFGTADGYAAAMAGVIATAAPGSWIEHASHEIEPGDVLSAALTLSRYALLYPPGTVHVVVVDPGVGTTRRPLAARIHDRLFVAPDNGVLTRVLRGPPGTTPPGAELVEIQQRERAGSSATFHGRDLFAPAAGKLARGESLESLGPPLSDPVLCRTPEPEGAPGGWAGEVIQVDRFGNLITNLPAEAATRAGAAVVRVDGRAVGPLRWTYGDVAPGELLALVGSIGLIEVSERNGSAAARLGAGRGARVTVGVEPG